MSKSADKKLRCIFYSHPWSVAQLDECGLLAGENEVLIELAQVSMLAQALTSRSSFKKLDLTQALQFSAKAARSESHSLFSLFSNKAPDVFAASAIRFSELSVPLILAPAASSPAIQIASLLSALALPSRFQQITALVHYQEAPLFASLFSYVDQFSILWDIADLPDKKLIDLTTSLVSDYRIGKERWGKFQLCETPSRQPPENENRLGQYQSLINEFFE